MNRDFALLDANIARAKEGIRLLEDAARFVLRDETEWQKLKKLRHRFLGLEQLCGGAHLVGSRLEEDLGNSPVVSQEWHRSSLYSIIRANSSRVSQALRILEEFAKIYRSDLAAVVKDMRYATYRLETALARSTPQFWLERYFADGVVYPIVETVDDGAWMLERGAKIVQLRDTSGDASAVYEKSKALCDLFQHHNALASEPALFILNDYVDIAAKLPVAGVHIGQHDTSLPAARRLLGCNKIIGRSNHSMAQIFESITLGADYVSIGPIFATPTKADREPVGLDILCKISKHVKAPWVAIGGIEPSTVQEVHQAGAKNVAVVRAAREFFT